MATGASFVIRAPLSSLDDDDDAATASSSSPSSEASRSPSPSEQRPRAAVPAAPRIAAQLTASTDEEEEGEEVFDDATDYEEEEVVMEVSNGFFRVARVPPVGRGPILGASRDEPAVSTSASSEYFGAVQGSWDGSFAITESVLDAAESGEAVARSAVQDVAGFKFGLGVEGSLDGSFESSKSILGVFDGSKSGAVSDFNNVTDGSVLKDKLGDNSGVVTNAVSEPVMGNGEEFDGDAIDVTDSLERKDGYSEHGDDGLGDLDDAEDASPEHVAPRHDTSELEVQTNVEEPPSITDGGQSEANKETDGGTEVSDGPAIITAFGDSNDVEHLGKELEGNLPYTKGTRFGLDNSDEELSDEEEEEQMNGNQVQVYDYAALAELLRLANRSPREGNAKVFPVETSESQQLSPTTASIPRTNISSTPVLAVAADPESEMTDEEKLYQKVDMIRIKYLRLVHRLGYSPEHQVAIQVLYRLSLAEGYRRIRISGHSSELENAWKRASQLEAKGIEDLEVSCNILVLGKTGVGKSATVNSIFGKDKSKTNAFAPATSSVKEIAGVVDGVKFRVIDTPGLGTSVMDEKPNRKVLNSVKKYIKRCPPDIVLYVDRLDTQRQDDNSISLLRCITSALGLQIWSKTIITLTHSAAAPLEGPNGSPVSYEMVVTQRTHALQQSIRQTIDDLQFENPVALVENHPFCRRNREGEMVLPNGLIWRRMLLLLCYSLKIVSDIDNLSSHRATSASLFGLRFQTPPLPYFLSSLLQFRVHPKHANEQNVEDRDSDVDLDELLDRDKEDEEDDYDQLPHFKPLSKSQVSKLPKEQQRLYFDEYDYRMKLLQKKQWKEQLRSLKEIKMKGTSNDDALVDRSLPDDEDMDNSPMPDWVLPSSFDSDDPAYRYRCLDPPKPHHLVRAVTNPEGWDHDCGFDGVSLQHSLDVANAFPASMWVQVNKDKREFTINLDSSVSAKHGDMGSTLAGFDIQTLMNQLAYTLRGETKFKNLKKNTTTGGFSMTFLGDTMVTGAKIEDKLSVGKRLTLVGNAGAVSAKRDTAYGVNMEACLRDKDYPVGQSLATLGASLVRWHKEWTMAANLESRFSVGRSSNMAIHVDVNNKLTGQVSIKASTSEQLKIALLGIYSTAIYLWNRMQPHADTDYE